MMKHLNLKLSALIALCVLVACSHREKGLTNCVEDFQFKANFQNCIQIISLRDAGYSVDLEYASDAYLCLKVLTNHNSYIDNSSDTPLFYPYSEDTVYLVEDIKIWSYWYERNKCKFDMSVADSTFKANSNTRDKIKWPPSLFEILDNPKEYK